MQDLCRETAEELLLKLLDDADYETRFSACKIVLKAFFKHGAIPGLVQIDPSLLLTTNKNQKNSYAPD